MANIVRPYIPGDLSKLICFTAELRIHEHTERGDNESIKQPQGTRNTLAGAKCCSSL